jgi:hypothetical protein
MSKVSNLKSIINGWSNLVFPSQSIENIAMLRALKCSQCPHIEQSKFVEAIVDTVTNKSIKQKVKKGSVCGLCKCPIAAKTRSLLEKCPDNRWEENVSYSDSDISIKLSEYNFKIKNIQLNICKTLQYIEKSSFLLCFIENSYKYGKNIIEFIDEINDDVFEMFGTRRKQKNLVYSKTTRLHKRSVPEINNSIAKSNFLFDTVKLLHTCIGDIIIINNTDFITTPDKPMSVKTLNIKNKEKKLIEKLENLLGIIQKELRDGIGKQNNIR